MRSKNLFFAAIWILFVLALSSSTPHLIATHFNFSLYISFSRVVNEFIKFLFQSNALLLWPTNAQNKKETYYRFRKGRKKKKKESDASSKKSFSTHNTFFFCRWTMVPWPWDLSVGTVRQASRQRLWELRVADSRSRVERERGDERLGPLLIFLLGWVNWKAQYSKKWIG